VARIEGAPDADAITFKQDDSIAKTPFVLPLFISFLMFQDENNNRVVECGRNERGMCILQTDEGSNRFHSIRHCVPSSGCHLLIDRDSYFGVYTEQREHTSFFNLTYGGELLARRDGFRFESIEFGSGCSQIVACKNDNDTLLKSLHLSSAGLFLGYARLNLTMLLKDGKDILLQDLVDPEALDLVYHRACFPKDSCLNLTLSVPETYNVTSIYHSSDTSAYYEFG
jgi:hypothetical protein